MANCRFKLKEMLNTLTSKEKVLAQFIIEFPSEVVNMSIAELANACDTSISTVVRLCKSAGYNGYKAFSRDLSIDIVQSSSAEEYGDIRPGSSVEAVMNAVCANDMHAIENTMAVLELGELERAVAAMIAARRVDFYGIGSSGHVAMDAYNKFVRINKLSMSTNDPHQQILNASQLSMGDVAVLISYSGNTKDILETADIVRQTPATLISLTKYSKNPLAKLADICLYSSSADALVRSGAMGSRIGQLTIIDILYTAVASSEYTQVKSQLDRTRLASAKKHTQSNPE
jgi:DNA-binding MurR/RpiR family transcriptional regulator|nr:MurR/RpiR family transcriptional regulator [uncultured Acetatifactor sp.]